MRIAQVFAHAIVRRIAYVLVAAVLAWCGMGRAEAAQCSIATCDRQQAYQACLVNKGLSESQYPGHTYACTLHPNYPASKMYQCLRTSSPSTGSGCLDSANLGFYECVAPKVWNESLKQCFSPSECLARNADLAPGTTTRNFTQRCVAGCELKLSGPTVGVEGLYSGVYQYTGNMCEPGPTIPAGSESDAKERPPQTCKPLGDSQICLKPDGQQCLSASTGRQLCWRPGETGEKDDGPVKQKRDAGTEAIPPNLQLPSGDNLQQTGTPKTTTTTVTNNTSTTTITTTTTNYTTQHGTNAGTKNQGESNTGDGSGKDEGEQDGTATGGGDCKTPPVVTGDQVLGMVATQAWHTRCAVEAGNAAKVTGDVGDCSQPFTVEGTHANAVQLRAMRAQICNGDKNGDGQPDWTKPDGTEAGEGGEDDEPGMLARMVNTDMLDTGGFLGGGGQCPQLGTIEFGPFGEFNLDSQPYFCDLIALMRGVVLLMGVFLSLRILTGDVL